MSQNQSITLFQLQEYIRRVLALNLPDALWVEAEIAEVNVSRGHRYLALVQKDPGSTEPVAAGDAVIWLNHWNRIHLKLGPELSAGILREGVQVRFKARVDYHERYGLKLMVEDIDPAYTLGLMEMQRRMVLERLQKERLLERNASLRLPPVLQRVAVISSEQGAGYQDFIKHLQQNPYGYKFHCVLFPAAVQGAHTASEITARLSQIGRQAARFDCTVLIRGGGARLDLGAFDNYDLCRAVATHPLPVLTGIGHDVDETLADHSAHAALKTPTAVADFIVRRLLDFESALVQTGRYIQDQGRQMLAGHRIGLEQLRHALAQYSAQLTARKGQVLLLAELEARRLFHLNLQNAAQQLDQLDRLGTQLHPMATLRRGFTLTLKDGQALRSAAEAQPGDAIETVFPDGRVLSRTVESKTDMP